MNVTTLRIPPFCPIRCQSIPTKQNTSSLTLASLPTPSCLRAWRHRSRRRTATSWARWRRRGRSRCGPRCACPRSSWWPRGRSWCRGGGKNKNGHEFSNICLKNGHANYVCLFIHCIKIRTVFSKKVWSNCNSVQAILDLKFPTGVEKWNCIFCRSPLLREILGFALSLNYVFKKKNCGNFPLPANCLGN